MKRLLAVSLMCVAVPLMGGTGKIDKKPRPVKDSYIVVLDDAVKPDAPALAAAFAKRHGGKVTAVWEHALRGFAIDTNEKAAEAIAKEPQVAYVEENQEADLGHCWFTHVTGTRCPDGSLPWNLDRIDQRDLPLNGMYEHCTYNRAEGVKVYVIDSGVRAHADFTDANGNSRIVGGWNVKDNNANTDDCFGHGTTVASSAAGRYMGIAKEATIVPVRVSTACNGANHSTTILINAVNWVTNDHVSGPAVANMSMWASSSSTALDSAANTLVNDGVVLTVAAGNGNTSACGLSPQRATNVITVGGTTRTDARWSSSNYGSCVVISAPAYQVAAAHLADFNAFNCSPPDPNGWSGTSLAAPMVAGVAAVIYKERYWYTALQIKQEVLTHASVGKISGMPNGTPNRLLYSANPDWCPWMSCDGPPPID